MSVRHDTPDPASLREALHCLGDGRHPLAADLARRALLAAPDDPAWLSVLALATSAAGRADEALPLYQRLVELQPRQAAHWSNLGNCLCELHRERDALTPMEQAFALGASDAGAHFAMARACNAHGDPRRGLRHVEQALAAAPGDVDFRVLYVQLLGAVDAWELARDEIAALLPRPLDATQRVDLAYALLRGGSHADAQALFAAVLVQSPGDTDARIGSILALERLNRIDAAAGERALLDEQLDASERERLRDKLLQLDARLAARQDDHPRAGASLETLLELPDLDASARIGFGFDLGAARVKCGQIDAAMAAFAQAHALRRAQVNVAHPALAGNIDLYQVMSEPLADAPPAGLHFDDRRRDPVFVVGFPRSGTTLLEQLLDAHAGLSSFDEQPFVQRLAQRLYARADTVQAALRTLDAPERQRLRASYFADADTVLPAAGDARPVDKNPLNLLRLPLLPHLFPDARVVLALRHPCDVVLSCYMQHFGAPAFAVTFETLEAGAEMYDRTFAHWWRMRDRLALPVHVLRYEDLVADTEAEARRLFAFLDLPWQDDLLRFTERARDRVIGTPSYAQVIEPVNRKAVGRWTAFRAHFGDSALARLEPWVERFGYPAL
ncbi:tetratricopeptide repeat-containing sulfotransferase family protein [Lysobacter solisilvae (ex Woo and Kim 2020)]|uniref:Sulfotransferase n=1 Tax=Agrilutibacter terrestris TaxID=2865112 RepID=A0A7H0G0H6_9GAMM|nr:sulfotransferase [Lysobacter terrestris]QNP41792.1 sulfotransferase [Lysobacter terrestris]